MKNKLIEKDNIILILHKDLHSKNSFIKRLNEEIRNLKKDKLEQEESFQNIIKDFQFYGKILFKVKIKLKT